MDAFAGSMERREMMMTREMAATYIKERCIGSADKPDGTVWSEAMWMAIKALQEPEIVRCGECRHMKGNGRCREFADDCIKPRASDFCSYGKRR